MKNENCWLFDFVFSPYFVKDVILFVDFLQGETEKKKRGDAYPPRRRLKSCPFQRL